METNTHLGNTIDAIDPINAKYDKNVKEFLSDIQILARIVKYTVEEVQDLSIDEIIGCIDEKAIETGVVPVEPGLTNLGRVEGEKTENAIPTAVMMT